MAGISVGGILSQRTQVCPATPAGISFPTSSWRIRENTVLRELQGLLLARTEQTNFYQPKFHYMFCLELYLKSMTHIPAQAAKHVPSNLSTAVCLGHCVDFGAEEQGRLPRGASKRERAPGTFAGDASRASTRLSNTQHLEGSPRCWGLWRSW